MHIQAILPVLAASLLLPVATAQPIAGKPPATRPNIVLFLADDHSWHDYGFSGNDKVKTPSVDALARESMVFTRAFTVEAICAPSRSALYTGLYPIRNGCFLIGFSFGHGFVREPQPVQSAESLKSARPAGR